MSLAAIAPLGNHLWQSTVFVLAVWLLSLACRSNRAAVRYWLWWAASVKFLIPLSILSQTVGLFTWRAAAAAPAKAPLSAAVEDVSWIFSLPGAAAATADKTAAMIWPLIALWWLGAMVAAMFWARSWMRMRRTIRLASPAPIDAPIPVLYTTLRLEPGVFGILKPLLLLPQDVAHALTPDQLSAIIAHELCHVRRRDNLTAAIHMLAETIFWFYPLLRWIRTRLVEERERACDQVVLEAAIDPEAYAEGILNVCKFYVLAPATCAAGVSGANLKRRIEDIMQQRVTRRLTSAKKLLFALTGVMVIAAPVWIGMLGTQAIRAQPQAKLAFEVASIKENKSPDRRTSGMQFLPGGKFVVRSVPLFNVVVTAYDVPFQADRLTGGPDWIRNTFYDIDASAPEGAVPPGLPMKERNARIMAMIRTLLADRFKMVVLSEVRERVVYAITVAKNGPKLQRSKIDEKDCSGVTPPASCYAIGGGQGRGIHGDAITIANVAAFVSNWADRPVIDKSGLTGLYNIQTTGWRPMRPRPPREEPTDEDRAFEIAPTLSEVLATLGLALEPQRAPITMYTIQSAERPSEN